MTTDFEVNSPIFRIVREEIKSELIPRGPDVCLHCGEFVMPDQRFKVLRRTGDYGEHLGTSVQHVDCANPTLNALNPTMDRIIDPTGVEHKVDRARGEY